MELALVAAQSNHRVIGNKGDLPWKHLAADLAHFNRITAGHPVIMGRKTYESIPEGRRPLVGRTNIVVTRDQDYKGASIVCGSLQEAISRAAEAPGADRICIIGGGQIFVEALPLADTVYLTQVEAELEGETFFPELPSSQWELKESRPFESGPGTDYPGVFQTYVKRT